MIELTHENKLLLSSICGTTSVVVSLSFSPII